jgi:NAD(P)-dependent dehydrogenase (short-subunit alcohol dehydrogenase family)
MYLEKLRLDGRVAVVTGGGQGIGAACDRALG